MVDPRIRVGIITDGKPVCRNEVFHCREGIRLDNVLIGEGFHWQKSISTFLPGKVEWLDTPQGNIHLVNVVPLESYIASVISSEMNPEAPLEFLKAHAVISRSWAIRKINGVATQCSVHSTEAIPGCNDNSESVAEFISWEESDAHLGFHVCSDDHCQRFQGFPSEAFQNALRAVEETRGLVLVDNSGEIADARFSKCCGGKTEIFSSCWADKDYPYLVSVPDPWCDLSSMDESTRYLFLSQVLKDYDASTDDFYEWEETVDKSFIREAIISRYGHDIGEVREMEVRERGLSGRITRLRIIGGKSSILVGKELPIRRLLSPKCLYSSLFDISDNGSGFRLKGRGWGHGVGLCQIGAARMAFEGHDFRSILSFYYPETLILPLS